MSGALILIGYALLVGVAGWWGVAAVAVHLVIMLAAIKR